MTPVALTRTMADRLLAERHRLFVGRTAELELFRELLADRGHSLLFLRGQAGVGKSSLLLELSRLCSEANVRAVRVDAAELADRSPQELARVKRRVGTEFGKAPGSQRGVLLLDSYERLGQQERWLLSDFVPALSADTLLVFASRSEPPSALSLDLAWGRLMLHREVQPLGTDDARSLLDAWQLPSAFHEPILDVAGGFPLILALGAELALRSPGNAPSRKYWRDLQRAVLELLCPEPLSESQRIALDVSAIARHTSLELLEYVLTRLKKGDRCGDARELFNWLAQQPIVEKTCQGIGLHVLPRMALLGRMRHDRSEKRTLLAMAVREFAVDALSSGATAETGLIDLLYLDREVPQVRQLSFPERETVGVPLEPATEADHAGVVDVVRLHEGSVAAELASAWLRVDPGAFEVIREQQVEAALHTLRLASGANIPQQLIDLDPAAALVQKFMAERPLDADEHALFFRWFLDRDEGQRPSARVFAVSARQAQIVLSTPRLAYSLCVYHEPRDWAEALQATGVKWLPAGRFTVGERAGTLICFDWRERCYRDVLVNSWTSPSRSEAPPASLLEEESRIKVRRRVAELGRTKQLTARELQVLELLSLGTSTAEISARLQIKPRTIKFHQENLLKKTGVTSRLELFRLLI